MSVKFFARFNLHNSICENPISVRHLRPFFDMTDDELEAMILEIKCIQNERVCRIKTEFLSECEALYGKRVVFFGDSITSDNLGYRDTVTLAAKLEATDGAVSGGTSSMILHSAKMHIEQKRPDIVSIMIGSNDSVCIESEKLPQVSLWEYERNVTNIVGWAIKSGASVLLFEIPPVIEERFKKSFDSKSKLQNNKNISLYNDVLKKIANSFGIPLICNNWLKDNEDLYLPDGIHLSSNGQEQFSKKWLEAAITVLNNASGKHRNAF